MVKGWLDCCLAGSGGGAQVAGQQVRQPVEGEAGRWWLAREQEKAEQIKRELTTRVLALRDCRDVEMRRERLIAGRRDLMNDPDPWQGYECELRTR